MENLNNILMVRVNLQFIYSILADTAVALYNLADEADYSLTAGTKTVETYDHANKKVHKALKRVQEAMSILETGATVTETDKTTTDS